jgi:hypothetical protein
MIRKNYQNRDNARSTSIQPQVIILQEPTTSQPNHSHRDDEPLRRLTVIGSSRYDRRSWPKRLIDHKPETRNRINANPSYQ